VFFDATASLLISINCTSETIAGFTPKLPSGDRRTLKALENLFWSYSEASQPATY
jgi:hypothetical protein